MPISGILLYFPEVPLDMAVEAVLKEVAAAGAFPVFFHTAVCGRSHRSLHLFKRQREIANRLPRSCLCSLV
jgi:hypothetical protein